MGSGLNIKHKVDKVFATNENVSRAIVEFLDRRMWNGPRMKDPTTWPGWLLELARQILAAAGEIHFEQVELGAGDLTGNLYSYDVAMMRLARCRRR